MTEQDEWYTRAEAASVLKVGERTIDRYVREGKLTKHRIAGKPGVRLKAVEVHGLLALDVAEPHRRQTAAG